MVVVTKILLLLLFPKLFLCEDKFTVSFQSSGGWSTNEFMEYTKEIPPMKEFTACHWEKLKYFSVDYVIVWSYCGIHTTNDESMSCVQFYYRGNVATANKHIDLYGWLKGEEILGHSERYKHRSWNHFCWSYSSMTGENKFYHNGHIIGNQGVFKNDEHLDIPTIEGDQGYEDSAFIIGQEQDAVRGRFEPSQIFNGELTELNVWNKTLEEPQIKSMARCESFPKGNIIAWIDSNFNIKNAIRSRQDNLDFLCHNEKQFVMFAEDLTLSNAELLCNAHGGRIATPDSKEENGRIMEIINNHKKSCLNRTNLNPIQMGRAVWLGLKHTNKRWYNVNYNGTISTLKYNTSWDKLRVREGRADYPNGGCAFVQGDGSWGFRDTATCTKLKLCTICSFDATPVFTLKGLCHKDFAFDYNYYMAINSSHQITHYDGHQTSNLTRHGSKWAAEREGVKVERHFTTHPLGRSMWNLYDNRTGVIEPQRRRLTLSVCELGKQFTCDSGQCVSRQSRCDSVVDCQDGTDEHNCVLVTIPKSYKRCRTPEPVIPHSRKYIKSDIFPIKIRFRVISFDQIDTVNMKIGITAEIHSTWKDSRLIFTNLVAGPNYVPAKTIERLWHPRDILIHENAVVGSMRRDSALRILIHHTGHSLPPNICNTIEDVVFSGRETSLEMVERFKVEYNCDFDLLKFPFDHQNCEIVIKMAVEKGSNFSLVGDIPPTIYNGSKTLYQFTINPLASYTTTDNSYTKFVVKVNLSRNFTHQMINTFFPTFLLWILAYSTLFIKVEDFTDRVMVTVVSLLALVSLLGSINTELPKTSYFKYINLWFLWYKTNILFLIICHIIISIVDIKKGRVIQLNLQNPSETQRTTRRPYMSRLNRIAIAVLPITSLIFNVVYFYIQLRT